MYPFSRQGKGGKQRNLSSQIPLFDSQRSLPSKNISIRTILHNLVLCKLCKLNKIRYTNQWTTRNHNPMEWSSERRSLPLWQNISKTFCVVGQSQLLKGLFPPQFGSSLLTCFNNGYHNLERVPASRPTLSFLYTLILTYCFIMQNNIF